MKVRAAITIALLAIALVAMPAPASARERAIDHGGTYVGETVIVAPDQIVQGDVSVFGGDAKIYGEVDGDVTTYGGTIETAPGSIITGRAQEYGGQLGSLVPWGGGAATIAGENTRITMLLAYGIIIVLIFLIFPARVRTALDRVERHPGLSAAVGVLALVASLPIALLLLISIIGSPLILVEFVAYVACVLIGQAALGLLIGRRLYELIVPHATPAPLGALIVGLVVLSAAEILPHVGWVVGALVGLIGLGAAVLAFVRETPFLTHGSVGPPPSGPPMPA